MKNFINKLNKEIKNNLSDLKHKETVIKQIPNLLTFSRLIAPLIIIPLIILNHHFEAMIITICFALTDLIDGRIARKYNIVSEFGRQLDPVCYKVFVGGIIIPLVFKNKLLIISLILEILVSILTIYSKSKKGNPKTNFLGKIKTTLLYILIACTYLTLFKNINNTLYLSIYIITLIIQIISLIVYTNNFLKEVKHG